METGGPESGGELPTTLPLVLLRRPTRHEIRQLFSAAGAVGPDAPYTLPPYVTGPNSLRYLKVVIHVFQIT